MFLPGQLTMNTRAQKEWIYRVAGITCATDPSRRPRRLEVACVVEIRARLQLLFPPMSAAIRALVVDDDEPIRVLLTKLLEQQGMSVDTARDGREAINRLDEDGYRVVLLDLMMPRVDGWGVLQHMRENHPDKLARTIVASAATPQQISSQLREEVFRVHSKPFDVSQLLADVRACAAG